MIYDIYIQAHLPLAITHFQPREIRPFLKQIARQAAYQLVDHRTHMDFHKPAGLIDHWTTAVTALFWAN